MNFHLLLAVNINARTCVDCIEVAQFSFGSGTPHIKNIHAYECVDGVGGGKRPITWTSIIQPTSGRLHGGSWQLVLEAHVAVQSDDFVLVLRSHMAGKWCDSAYAAILVLLV